MPDQDLGKAKPATLASLASEVAFVRGFRKEGSFDREVRIPASEFAVTPGVAAGVTTEAAAGAANITEVTFQVVDADSNAIEAVQVIDIFLSDAATGLGLTAVTASGTVTAKAASGEVVGTLTAKKALRVQTLADGTFVLEITDTAKTDFYPCAVIPSTGKISVGTQLETADYGDESGT